MPWDLRGSFLHCGEFPVCRGVWQSWQQLDVDVLYVWA